MGPQIQNVQQGGTSEIVGQAICPLRRGCPLLLFYTVCVYNGAQRLSFVGRFSAVQLQL